MMNVALVAHATPFEWSMVLMALAVGLVLGVGLAAWVRLRSGR